MQADQPSVKWPNGSVIRTGAEIEATKRDKQIALAQPKRSRPTRREEQAAGGRLIGAKQQLRQVGWLCAVAAGKGHS